MRPPIIVDARGDVSIYESAEDAQRDLEAIDVRNGEYAFFDAEGSILRGVIVPRFARGILKYLMPIEVVALELASEPGGGAAELRRVLTEFLAKVGVVFEGPPESLSLDELIAAMLRLEHPGRR